MEAHDYRPAMTRFLAAARENPKLLFDVELQEPAVAVDVGGYEGEWSGQILSHAAGRGLDAIELHVFEPEPNSLEHLHTQFDEDPRVRVHPFGLGGRDRFERMAVGGPGTSQFKSASQSGFWQAVDLELRDASAVLDELAIEQVDVMMVNIEGGEYELLDRLYETGWLGRVNCLLVQFHEFAPDAYRARRRSRAHLAETHRCTWNYTWVFERWDVIRSAR